MMMTKIEDQVTPDTVGARIIAARKQKEMTQQDLASALGISRAAIGQWEIDKNSPSLQKVGEIAKITGVAPQWIAYGVKPGEVEIRYRNPERDNIQWIEETTFGETPEDKNCVSKFGVPVEYLSRGLNCNHEQTILCTINSHAVEPEYEYGDKVFVDQSDTRPSPAGVFAYWDGVGMVFGKLQALPGTEPKVKISAKGQDDIVMPLKELTVLGRVKARIQRG